MKPLLILCFLLIINLSFCQERTYTKSQLDSISKETVFSEKHHLILKEKDTTSFKIIEHIPVYKGCEKEKNNAAKKNCMSQKIAELFKTHFKTTLPNDSKVPSGKARISLQFYIDKDGSVINSTAKAPDEYLENEALRVLKLIPKFTPGYQRGKPVKVPYSLPIVLEVENENEDLDNFSYPIFRGCEEKLSNEELKKCSKRKIMNFIKMSFDLAIADVALPQEKSTQFRLDFIINKKGKVEHVNAKANHRAIAIEAIRVTKRLPKFKKPGTKNGKPVNTPFSLLMTIYF